VRRALEEKPMEGEEEWVEVEKEEEASVRQRLEGEGL